MKRTFVNIENMLVREDCIIAIVLHRTEFKIEICLVTPFGHKNISLWLPFKNLEDMMDSFSEMGAILNNLE